MNHASAALRTLLADHDVVRLMGAHDALGATLVEQAGFDGVWASGLEISTSHGVPDANILTMSEFLAASASMVAAVDIPVVADCDTGFGNSNNVMHMVRRFEAAGVAAVCMEDKLFPKVNSFVPGRQELAPLAEFVGKIMAAKSAQRTENFIVIARIEALVAGRGMQEAIRRASAYERAGADALLIHSKATTVSEIEEFLAAYSSRVPIVVVPTTYPDLTASELSARGARMVIYANQGIRASISAMEDVFAEILETGSTRSIEGRIAPIRRIFDLQGMPQMKAEERSFLRTEEEPTRAVILAAGSHQKDPSLAELTRDVPISMLDVVGKPLLQRQIEVLHRVGVQDVTVVTGYRSGDVAVDGVRVVPNADWDETGELQSLFLGATGPDRNGDERTLVMYGDVLFDESAVRRLLKADGDIVLLLDRTWTLRNSDERKRLDLVAVDQPSGGDRRYLESDAYNRVTRIGKDLESDQAHCEFTGLALLRPAGFSRLTTLARELASSASSGAFHEAAQPARAGLTDALQEAVNRGEAILGVEVSSGWVEIHTFDDYELACRLVRS